MTDEPRPQAAEHRVQDPVVSHHRKGDELDRTTDPSQPQPDQKEPSHDCSHHQPVNPVFLHDPVDDDDECARRSADLHAASAEGGYESAGSFAKDFYLCDIYC